MFKRVLLKLSGEALMGDRVAGIDPHACASVAQEIRDVVDLGIELVIVVGGGNLFRGVPASRNGLGRATADYIGMLGTVMNALALGQSLEDAQIPTVVMSSLVSEQVSENYVRATALGYLEKKFALILAGGTGNPYFTTDSAAVLRALELDCEIVLKGTKTDGIYDKDPAVHADAVKYSKVSYEEALGKQLSVMDMTAFALARDNGMKLQVFNFFESGALKRVICGEQVGTKVEV